MTDGEAKFIGIAFGGVPPPAFFGEEWQPKNYFLPVTNPVFVVEYARYVYTRLEEPLRMEATKYLAPCMNILYEHNCTNALDTWSRYNAFQSKL